MLHIFVIYVSFEGVCLTPVILATARGEGRLRAAGPNVISAGKTGKTGNAGNAGKTDEFLEACFCRQARYFRALDRESQA